jgi:acetyl-CoA synthetase
MYERSINDNDNFWREHGKIVDWIKPYTKIKEYKFSSTDTNIKWYYDGTLNACYNCVDRHIKNGKGDQIAIIWESNDPNHHLNITYNNMYEKVCKLANGYKSLGIKKGDKITIYMSMVPEIIYAMLACVRIGAVHNVIFGGFSPESIAKRLENCVSEWIITVDHGLRGAKTFELKTAVDQSLKLSS